MSLRRVGQLQIESQVIERFCRRWQITELSLFGSVLREDFGPQSDIDVLVVLSPDGQHSVLDLEAMRQELEALLGREVDLVEKGGLINPFRRRSILGSCELVYAA